MLKKFTFYNNEPQPDKIIPEREKILEIDTDNVNLLFKILRKKSIFKYWQPNEEGREWIYRHYLALAKE